MKGINVLLIIMVSLLCFSCNSYKEVIKGSYTVNISSSLEGGKTHFFGTVISKEDNMPVPSAAVSVVNTDIGTMTTEEGEFKILIEAGQYQLIINAVGYNDLRTRKMTIEKGKNLEIIIQLGTTKIYQKK